MFVSFAESVRAVFRFGPPVSKVLSMMRPKVFLKKATLTDDF